MESFGSRDGDELLIRESIGMEALPEQLIPSQDHFFSQSFDLPVSFFDRVKDMFAQLLFVLLFVFFKLFYVPLQLPNLFSGTVGASAWALPTLGGQGSPQVLQGVSRLRRRRWGDPRLLRGPRLVLFCNVSLKLRPEVLDLPTEGATHSNPSCLGEGVGQTATLG